MVEDILLLPEGKLRFTKKTTKDNIAFRGEDIRKGDVVAVAGRQIRPQDIAVLASVGYVDVRAGRKPSVAVLSTGSELVEPSEKPAESQIRNSNASQLMAQIVQAGAAGKYYGIAGDHEEETFLAVEKALSENDIVIITGGVSMGDFDFVPSVIEKAGVRILFNRVAVQPGKPTTFGIHREAIVFGLPGNPVSSFMQFELLVKPLILKMMGGELHPVTCLLPMADRYIRKSADRMMVIPVKITGERQVVPVEYHGSAHISAIPGADGVISMETGKKVLENGEFVEVRLF
jgi:molybdopterin molybdotransferase